MFSKSKDHDRNDAEQREQYEYARRRLKQKKGLMRHFVLFLAGSIFFIILDPLLKVGHETIGQDWYVWAILIWAFLLMVHAFNVLILHKFMGKEWEDRQLEKLKTKQAARIAELQKQVDAEIQLPKGPTAEDELKKKAFYNPLPPDVE